jgi:arylformamidase
MNKSIKQWVWLSHVTTSLTPAYGGKNGFIVAPDKEIRNGDSCNTVSIQMSNHIGSHVDAPRHFKANGTCVDQYRPEDWIFTQPLLVNIPVKEGEIVTINHLQNTIPDQITNADLVLIKTGAEHYRNADYYWKNPPGFSPDICNYLCQRFENFNAIGIDTISISSFAHRNIGRLAHKEFLGKGIRIIEDMALAHVNSTKCIEQVIALPFRFSQSDGSPITVVAQLLTPLAHAHAGRTQTGS